MRLYNTLQDSAVLKSPVAASFGTFDGVHLGHQFIFERVKEEATKSGGKSALLTFSNHPSELIFPDKPTQSLTSHEQKMALIEGFGFDVIVDLPFDEYLRNLSADEFLKVFRKMVPFSTLVVGSDVTFGKGRLGNRDFLQSKSQEFNLVLLERYCIDNLAVSSSLIRQKILQGDLPAAKKLLGRSYAIQASFVRQNDKLVIEDCGCALPPPGEYDVIIKFKYDTTVHKATLRISSVLEISHLDYTGTSQLDQGFVEITL
jgi:riboflavin kinase/FMN adenylyltransferase